MRLADFILRNMEAIVAQWEAFAGDLRCTIGPMDRPVVARDNLARQLTDISRSGPERPLPLLFQERFAQGGRSEVIQQSK
jgi:hypothetical protein